MHYKLSKISNSMLTLHCYVIWLFVKRLSQKAIQMCVCTLWCIIH